ncbi:hypothetical protein Tco_0862339 [Tanacetum coccineum]
MGRPVDPTVATPARDVATAVANLRLAIMRDPTPTYLNLPLADREHITTGIDYLVTDRTAIRNDAPPGVVAAARQVIHAITMHPLAYFNMPSRNDFVRVLHLIAVEGENP